jgi:flagellar export protein FliJ
MARRFQFRLEQVLRLRRQVEEARVRELALAKGRLLQIEEALKAHAEAEKDFLTTYGSFEKGDGFTTDQVMVYCHYRDWLSRREKEYRRSEKEWMKEVERRRLEAVKASRGRRLLENLKEKRKKAHAQELLGEEQKFLDEVSSIAFVRRERAQRANAGITEK